MKMLFSHNLKGVKYYSTGLLYNSFILHIQGCNRAEHVSSLRCLLSNSTLSSLNQVIENCPVTGIQVRTDDFGIKRVKAVETSHGTIETPCVVNCAGEIQKRHHPEVPKKYRLNTFWFYLTRNVFCHVVLV